MPYDGSLYCGAAKSRPVINTAFSTKLNSGATMFPSSFANQTFVYPAASLQVLVNVAKRYASGLQQLAELNVQTAKTVFEESTAVAKAGPQAKPADFLSWQSTLLAETPEKAAAYTRHFWQIVRATQTDILNEARGPIEQFGFGLKKATESASQEAVGLLSSAAEASTDLADAGAEAIESSEKAVRAAKADAKR
ncbi:MULTISPECIES: TIGR01841 family phasin [Caballeronia]|uniref:TIGR01841 family phasin n=1 Tax=Caballeronia jiangsuensis TaxID=1458357 RepID=A0ABW9CUH7_9BURK|nr:TIGR01841 family phasin [Caballeronia sp. GaOx3]